MTQPSAMNVSGRGRRAGHGGVPLPLSRSRGARGPPGRGLRPVAPSRHPPRPPGVRARPARSRARGEGARRRSGARGGGPQAAAGAHRAPALQRHVLPEQQLQLVQEAHGDGGAALRPPRPAGSSVRPAGPSVRRAARHPPRGGGVSRPDRLRAGPAPRNSDSHSRPPGPRRPGLKAPRRPPSARLARRDVNAHVQTQIPGRTSAPGSPGARAASVPSGGGAPGGDWPGGRPGGRCGRLSPTGSRPPPASLAAPGAGKSAPGPCGWSRAGAALGRGDGALDGDPARASRLRPGGFHPHPRAP